MEHRIKMLQTQCDYNAIPAEEGLGVQEGPEGVLRAAWGVLGVLMAAWGVQRVLPEPGAGLGVLVGFLQLSAH